MRELRVLVVDDSAYNRRTLGTMLESLDQVTVVGKAGDGDEALRLLTELEPDLVTLDLEMPRMDGFTFLRFLMARRPTPVIVVSGYSQKDNVFRALELGAIDFVAKPSRTVTSDLHEIHAELAEKVRLVRQLSPASITPRRAPRGAPTARFFTAKAAPVSPRRPKHLVLIGASTGGPTALLELFADLPQDSNASIVVAQHMPERFTKTFAERLNRLGTFRVKEASAEHSLRAGEAWICPGGRCLEVIGSSVEWGIRVASPSPEDRYVPSVDRLFSTAARVAGASTLGVILTGMGDDGSQGVKDLKASGAKILAEAAESAVIYGMPAAAVRTGAVDQSLPLRELAGVVATKLRG
ncbi:MAG: chemotaxis-specific protein-glutamate methyltransferase CheB [Myxococcota bacterium]